VHTCTGSGRNTWRFCKTVVSGTVGVGNLSLSALLARLRAIQLPWSAGLSSIGGFCCGDVFQKQRFCLDSEDISSALQYSSERVSLVAILLPLEDISRARCTKRNQGQRWIWNRTSGKKGRQFLPACCNEWCRNSRNAWGNVLTTRDTASQTLYSGSECCN